MNMPVAKSQNLTAIAVLLATLCSPVVALDADQLGWTETKEKWGQVLFCQRIYKMPEVQSRLYSFDVEQCDSAGQLVMAVVAKYSEQQKMQLQQQAEQHAVALGYNTREPYHSVAACREYCRKLADIQDKFNDQ